MSQTTAPDAYDNLLQLLATSTARPVPVVDSDPGTRIPNEYVTLTGITAGEKQYGPMAGGGRSPQYEHFVITGEIHAYTGGATATQAKTMRDRAFAVLAWVDDVVQLHVDLGLPNRVLWAVLSTYELTQGPTDKGGRGAVIPFTVSVSAYLT